ncbi:MAG: iron chelate uptake ABC transporter family permease subunit [Planctomycetota bacterium]
MNTAGGGDVWVAPSITQHGHSTGPVSLTDVQDAWPTLEQTLDVLLFRAGYNTTVVVISTTLLGVAAGIVGVFALLRKRSLVGDALSHATLPGIGLAFIAATWLGYEGRSLPVLLLGATVTGVLGVLCIQWLLRHTRLHEDASIGLVLSVFFGAGAVILSVIQTMRTGNAAGLSQFIYGQTAAMNAADAKLMAGIAGAAVLAAALLLKEFSMVCFNDAFAKVNGWPVSVIDLLMMALVVVVTVAGLQAVGLILVVALLIIPAVAARFWTDRLWVLVVLAAVIGGLSGYLGASTSALLPRKPAGAVIVLVCGGLFVVSMLAAPRRGVVSAALRRLRLKLSIASDHLLEAAYLRGEGRTADEARVNAEALALLKQRRAWGPMLTAAVSAHLRRRGLGVLSASSFVPTAAGVERGRQVCRNHRLWEQYLISYADIAPGHLDWTVDRVEHVLGEELVAKLEHALGERAVVVPPASPNRNGGEASP